MERVCKGCNKSLSIDLFRKDRQYITYTCKSCYSNYLKKYRESNSIKIKQQKDAWYIVNKDYLLDRRKNNINLKLSNALRVRLNIAIKKNIKSGSSVKDLGCSIQELKIYIESKFQPGMTWNNWGRGSDMWHIDHIKPLSLFNLSIREQLLEACNYINLQPMWEKDNIAKSNKVEV